MKKILLTGGSGFVGSNVIRTLQDKYILAAPNRQELDVRDRDAVERFVKNEYFDAIIHLASPSPVRSPRLDSYDKLFSDCIKIFMNFYAVREKCGKIIYSGSGAEYGKHRDISLVKEEEIGQVLPLDDYGMAKYVINELARNSDNIYNLRIFGCFGPGEYDSKFITHAIRCSLRQEAITIRQDCFFDYLYVDNYAKYLEYFIENEPKYHDYNATSGKRVLLSELADIVSAKMKNKKGYSIMSEGCNFEYTADNSRILSETKLENELISLEEGIDRLIAWEMKKYETESC